MRGRWRSFFPFLLWLPIVNKTTLRSDLEAGITNALLVLPQGVAFALIAGMPPEYGLYTAMVTPIIAGLFGSSLHMISGPTTAISIVIFASMGSIAVPSTPQYISMVLTMTLLAGLIQLAFGAVRLGRLVNFVSHNVVVGFTAGAAILIASSQLTHVFGIELSSGANIISRFIELAAKIDQLQWQVPFVAFATIIAALLSKRFIPLIPHLLVAMLFGAALGHILDPQAQVLARVPQLPNSLPFPPVLPDLSLDTIRRVAPSAFVVAVLGLIEAVSIGRAIGLKSRQRIDGDQEFIGQGLSNIIGSMFSAYAGSGSFTRSGVNYSAGAKTPFSAIFAALCLGLILLFVAPLASYLNYAAMGGIIMIVAWNLINWSEIRNVFNAGRSEWGVLALTFFAALFTPLEFAVLGGVLLSLIIYLNRTARPRIIPIAPDPSEPKRRMASVHLRQLKECPQVQIASVVGSIFFGAAQHTADGLARLRKVAPERKHLLLQMDGVNFVDLEGARLFADEASTRKDRGGDILLAGLKEDTKKQFAKFGVLAQIGEDNIYRSKTDAVEDLVNRLDPDICSRCEARIFKECAYRPIPIDFEEVTPAPSTPKHTGDYILD